MENKLDRFFKNKLEEHTVAPSAEAWTKVEATLSKKNNLAVWRIAAAVLLAGALISAIIWSQQGIDKNNPENLASQSSKKKLPPSHAIENKSEAKPWQEPSRNLSVNPTPKIKSQEKAGSPEVAQSKSLQTENKSEGNKNQEATSETQSTVVQTTVIEKNKPVNTNEQATLVTATASTQQKPIKLEFTLEDFSSEQPVATVNEEKSTRLKKVLELAREVKNGEGPVRDMKNELFALSFRKNKNQ